MISGTLDDPAGPDGTPYQRLLARSAELAARPRVLECRIRMRDGIDLAADVHLPADLTEPVPAIVEITPYDKRSPVHLLPEAAFYQQHGYAFVAVDVRGRGKSDGDWVAFVHDGTDTYDVIEWAAAQDWCDGNIGMTGVSYMAWVQWAAAVLRPPHLRCLVSTSAAGAWQQETPYTNGIFQLYFAWWVGRLGRRLIESSQPDWPALLRTLPVGDLATVAELAGPTWSDAMTHDTLDDFWRALRFDQRYGDIDVPCLHVTGWYDLEDVLGAFHHYEHMMAGSPAADRQRLLVGPWSHLKARFPDSRYGGRDFGAAAALDMDATHLRWFDHWLKGVANGVPDDAPVLVFQPGTDVWRALPRWPSATGWRDYHLRFDGSHGRLDPTAPLADPDRCYRYDPADPVPTGVDLATYPVSDVALEQSANEARPDVLGYTSDVLAEPVVVSGRPTVTLFAASDCEDTDWHVKLLDVHPDGRSYRVSQGCLRAACRESPSTAEPLVPGEVYAFPIELWPTQHAFLPGHRIRFTVTSSDFPWFARSLNIFEPVATACRPKVATNTVCHSAGRASLLRLPVED